jgi:Diacylglycerol kinase catalytic domain
VQLAEDAIAGGADVIGMAGGDGSQALVATVAARHRIPHVVVPAGTRNHFALDLGLDRDAKLRTAASLLPDLLGPEAEPLDLWFAGPDATEYATAHLILVSNNPYQLDNIGGRGTRERIDGGTLGLVAARINRRTRRDRGATGSPAGGRPARTGQLRPGRRSGSRGGRLTCRWAAFIPGE